MGFFGMLIAVAGISIVLLLAKEAIMLHVLNMMAYAENAYTNMQRVNAFYAVIENTQPSNTLQYNNWLNAVRTCALQDGISIYIANSTITIRSSSEPYFSKAASITG
ncbi:MAG: hypothetical protein ACP5UH_01730 [Candidatus Micrarchaeia archaeon]